MRIKLFFILLVSCIPYITASEPTVFRQINSAKDLSNNYINAFLEDSYGYLWIGTSYGLNRYDGYTFEHFYNDFENANSINSNYIQEITEDYKKNIWIIDDEGLSCYSYLTGTFTRYPFSQYNVSDQKSKKQLYPYSICSYKGLLYIGTNDGIYVLNTETERLNKIFIKEHFSGNIRSILMDRDGLMWFSANDIVYRYNPKSGAIKKYNTPQSANYKLDEATVKIRTDKYFNIWAAAPSGIYKYDKQNDKMEIELPMSGNIDIQIEDSLIWIATWNRGLLKYHLKSKSFDNFIYTGKRPFEVNSNTLTTIYIDRNKNLWIGNGGKGVNIYNVQTSFFKTFKHEYNDPHSLSSSQIRAILCDRSGQCWIDSSFGLNKYNDENNTFIRYLSSKKYKNDGDLNNSILSLCEDNNGKLWVGTLSGLNIFNNQTGEYSLFSSADKHEALTSNQIWNITKDGDGMLWIGTRMGLYYFNPVTFDFKTYIFDPENKISTPNRNSISALFQDGDKIWVGTKDGLLRVNSSGKVDTWTYQPENNKSLSANQINAIYKDRKNRLWICTNRGLSMYISDDKGFKNYMVDKVKNMLFLGILEDSMGILWITSSERLIRFNPDSGMFDTFSTQDGLIGNEFCPGAFFKTSDDVFYAGGVDGLNIFIPKNIHITNDKPNLHFTQFKLFDEIQSPIVPGSPLKNSIDLLERIDLSHNQNFFSISYTSINLSGTQLQQYAYILEGFDSDWIKAGSRRTAYYTKVPPGKYTFKVKLINPNYPDEENIKNIEIFIRKPFYITWWAYLVYLCIGIFFLYLFRKYTLINTQEKNSLIMSKMEKEKEMELHNLKVRFFMNISHEFRTPLTLINGPVQNLLESEENKGKQKMLLLIQKNSNKLLHLIDQLLEFRKSETGTWQLRVSENDIIRYTTEILSAFEELSERKAIQLQFKTNLEHLSVWFDADMYEKILSNLLSNAFKYTNAGERITIYLTETQREIEVSEKKWKVIDRKKKEKRSFACILVEDTGVGIAPDKLEKIFDRFYQIKTGKSSTGIGLSLVKNLVELHKGYISASSIVGIYTKIEVLLPLGKSHFSKESLLEKIPNNNYIPDIKSMYVSNLSEPTIESNTEDIDLINNSFDDEEKPVILIVEDNTDIISYVKSSLDDKYKIYSALNGKSGFTKALQHIPDLILCDINMPQMNGIELTQEIKKNDLTSHIPVILITALSSLEYELDGLSHGADDYITKPFNIQILELKIKNLLSSRNELRKKFEHEMIFEKLGPKNIDTSDKFLERFNTLLAAHLSNSDLDVDLIVDEMAMSRSQLYRKIKLTTGMSVKIYVRTYRLIYAKNLLHNKDVRISEVMDSVGITSRSYFIKSFKKLYNMTPSEYQESIFNRGINETPLEINHNIDNIGNEDTE